jgi:hypothetical protein
MTCTVVSDQVSSRGMQFGGPPARLGPCDAIVQVSGTSKINQDQDDTYIHSKHESYACKQNIRSLISRVLKKVLDALKEAHLCLQRESFDGEIARVPCGHVNSGYTKEAVENVSW